MEESSKFSFTYWKKSCELHAQRVKNCVKNKVQIPLKEENQNAPPLFTFVEILCWILLKEFFFLVLLDAPQCISEKTMNESLELGRINKHKKS